MNNEKVFDLKEWWVGHITAFAHKGFGQNLCKISLV